MKPTPRIIPWILAALLAIPAVALSQPHGRGGGHGGGGGSRSGGPSHSWSQRGNGQSRQYRAPARESRPSRGRAEFHRDRGSTRVRDSYRRDTRREVPYRNDRRYRDRREPIGPTARGRDRDGGYPYGGGRHDGYRLDRHDRYGHRSHSYYTHGFHRPRFAYHSRFSLGFALSTYPSYGTRYYDPYCGIPFRSLRSYVDHCWDLGHPEAILVVDRRSGAPIATCVYSRGRWVVDDSGYDAYGAGEYDDY